MSKALDIANKNKLSVKKVETFTGRDGIGINTVVYIDGNEFLNIHDSGNGGCLSIGVLGELIKTADGYKNSPERENNLLAMKHIEAEIDKVPKYLEKCSFGDYMNKLSLEDVVNAVVSEFLNKKEIKKLEKKGILLENADGEIDVISWGKVAIPTLFKKYGKEYMIPRIQRTYNDFAKRDEKILNLEYLKSIGIQV